MFIELFPSTLFLVKVKNHEKIKKECLDYVVPEYEKTHQRLLMRGMLMFGQPSIKKIILTGKI